jgi:Zn finger protein HypA/HybF involved in hydrogenase expression
VIIKQIISEERCIDESTGQINPDLVKVKLVVNIDGQLNSYEKKFLFILGSISRSKELLVFNQSVILEGKNMCKECKKCKTTIAANKKNSLCSKCKISK